MEHWHGKLASGGWRLALLLVLALLYVDSAARWQDSERVTRARSAETPVPAIDPQSPTGYAFGQRRLILVPYSVDGYNWLMQTQEVLAGKSLRVHFVKWDNSPAGREAHWSSGLVWWLAGLAWVDHGITGRPLPLALEHIAPLASPILLAIFLTGLTPVLVRRFGALTGVVVLAGFFFCQPVYNAFVVGYIDHHGLAGICAMLSVLFLAAGGGGWLRDPTIPRNELTEAQRALADWLPNRRAAGRWFVAAAIASAAGLWVSAASQAPILVGIGLGVLASAPWTRSPSLAPWRPDPALWRLWGFTGALASLFFYLLEYFPNPWSLRLEVNHPLYALAWLGAGDLLCRICSPSPAGGAGQNARSLAAGLPGVLAILALPLVILIARDQVFVVSDPFLWALHKDYIGEFQPYIERLTQGAWKSFSFGIWHPLFGLAVGCALILRRGIEQPWKSLLALAAFPGALSLGLTLKQERWLLIADPLSIATLAVGVLAASRSPSLHWTRLRVTIYGMGLTLLLFSHPLLWGFYFLHRPTGIPADSSTYLTVRSLAHSLRQRLGPEPGVIVGGFSATTEMIYFGGFRGLGTGYWENRDGLRAAVEILGADSDETALALIQKYGITHIVDASWDVYSTPAYRLLHKMSKDETPVDKGFLSRLEAGNFPVWVRPIISVDDRQKAMVYEIDPRQTPPESLVRNARFCAEIGITDRAKTLAEQALALDPANAPALIVLASLQASTPDHSGLAATLGRLQGTLEKRPKLEAADHLDLAGAWLAAGNENAAREEAAAALAATNERELRRLSAHQLRRLLDLAGKWNLPFPAGVTADFAVSLLPKVLRPDSSAAR